MGRPRLHKRRFFVKKEFQWKFILLYSLCVSAVAGLTTYFLFGQIERAVERHLYSSHLKVEKTGDFLLDLLFGSNFIAIVAIVGSVLLISLFVFNRINRNFYGIQNAIAAMARGDFSETDLPTSRFNEIDRLKGIVEQTRQNYRSRFIRLSEALEELEAGAAGQGDPALLKSGRARLEAIVGEISFT